MNLVRRVGDTEKAIYVMQATCTRASAIAAIQFPLPSAGGWLREVPAYLELQWSEFMGGWWVLGKWILPPKKSPTVQV